MFLKIISLLMILCIPSMIFANAGVPMFIAISPVMILLLIPVIYIEAYIVSKRLRISFNEAYKVCKKSNLISTLVGVPLFGILAFVLLFWGVMKLDVDYHWIYIFPFVIDPFLNVYTLFIPYCIWCFFVSWFVEYKISKKMLAKIDTSKVLRVIGLANVMSYLFLIAVLVMYVQFVKFY